MNTKQKIYDLKNQQKELTVKMAEMLEKNETGDDYAELEKQFDGLQSQVDACEKQLEREKQFEGAAEEEAAKGFKQGAEEECEGVLKGLKRSVVKSFAQGVRKAMNEGTGSAGGYTVPQDIVTRIYELVVAEESFLDYITNESVRTETGARTYKTRNQLTGFATAAEAAKIAKVTGPTFGRVNYTIVKRGGILPVTNELLADTDENLTAIILKWFADEARATINAQTVAKCVQTPATEIASIDTLVTVLTTGLGSAFRPLSTIHTNDAGLLYLSTLKDGVGRPLLQADPTNPMRMILGIGPVAVPIKAWDMSTLPNTANGKVPFIVGSLKEGIFRFDREMLSITQSGDASIVSGDTTINAFEEDLTLFRGLMRDDYQVRDAAAFKYCLLTPASAPTLSSIAVTTNPTKTTYTAGEDFEIAGAKITATYSDSSTAVIDNSLITVLDGDDLTQGKTSVTLAYGEGHKVATAAVTITVNAAG